MNNEESKKDVLRKDIALEIQHMVEIDQDMRIRSHNDNEYWDSDIDKRHTERMREIIKEIGLPTISIVGDEGAHNAWLLIQHADNDAEFQKEYLRLMKEAPAGEVRSTDVAYLEDRVRVNQGMGQLYGTQFTQKDGIHIPRTIEDPENVDTRRAQMGMDTLDDQIRMMYEKYPNP